MEQLFALYECEKRTFIRWQKNAAFDASHCETDQSHDPSGILRSSGVIS